MPPLSAASEKRSSSANDQPSIARSRLCIDWRCRLACEECLVANPSLPDFVPGPDGSPAASEQRMPVNGQAPLSLGGAPIINGFEGNRRPQHNRRPLVCRKTPRTQSVLDEAVMAFASRGACCFQARLRKARTLPRFTAHACPARKLRCPSPAGNKERSRMRPPCRCDTAQPSMAR